MKHVALPLTGFVAFLSLLGASICRAERIDLYVMAGQSNMYGILGRDEVPPDLLAPQDIPFKFSMQYTPTRTFVSDGFIDLQPLSNFGFQYFISTYASELTFGEAMRQGSDRKIAILKVCANATTLAVDWNPDNTVNPDNPATPPLYRRLIDATSEALDELADLGYQPAVKGLVWVQGENDAQVQAYAQSYASNLGGFLDSLRSEEFFPVEVPIVVNQLHIGVNIPYDDPVRNAQATVTANRLDNIHLLNNDDLTLYSDLIHYSAEMQFEVGRRLAGIYLSAVPEPSSVSIAATMLCAIVTVPIQKVRCSAFCGQSNSLSSRGAGGQVHASQEACRTRRKSS